MRPRELTLEGFLSWRERTVVTFDSVSAGVLVGENGAGKTALVEAIGWALFGKSRASADGLISTGESRARVALRLEVGPRTFTITREREHGKATTLDVEVRDAPGLLGARNLTRPRLAETQELIERILGLDYETWLSTSFVGQGQADRFTSLRPSERKELLASVLGLEVYDRLAELARERERDAAAAAVAAQRRMEALEDRIAVTHLASDRTVTYATVIDRLAEAEVSREEAEKSLVGLRFEAEQVTQEFNAATEALSYVRTQEALRLEVRQRITRLQREIAGATRDLAASRKKAQRLEATEARAEWHQGARDRAITDETKARRRLEKMAAEITEAASQLAAASANKDRVRILLEGPELTGRACPVCGQSLEGQRLEAVRHGLQAQRSAASNAAHAAERRLRKIRAEEDETRRTLERRQSVAKKAQEELNQTLLEADRAREASAGIPQAESRLEELTDELSAARDSLAEDHDLKGATQRRDAAAEKVNGIGRAIRQGEESLQAIRERIAAYMEFDAHRRRDEQEFAESKATFEQEAAKRWRWTTLAAAFGRGGIPARIIETAIPAIEAETNRLLQRYLDERLSVALRSLRATKAGDIRETLDIIVYAGGDDRPLEELSGGERQAVDLALRIALARVLAERAGQPIETLILDETFTAFDAEHRTRALELLTGLRAEFDLILLITHLEDMAEAFPSSWRVSRGPDGSRLEAR